MTASATAAAPPAPGRLDERDRDALAVCRRSIEHHSKSFALASKVLPPDSRDSAAVLYAWCRHVNDAVDLAPVRQQAAALQRLRDELDEIYGDDELDDPILGAFQKVARAYLIPREYPQELIEGMAMDVSGQRYESRETLYLYCYRVASVVGLMMTHIMGLRDQSALRQAAHMGIGMQLTNICRDVLEDWTMGRLYLPDDLLADVGAPDLRAQLGSPLPLSAKPALARAVGALLDDADRFYRSGDRGLGALPWRCAFAVRAARLVYSRIGLRLRRRGCDVFSGRAFVPTWKKLLLVGRAGLAALVELPGRALRRTPPAIPTRRTRFPNDVLPV